MRIARLAFGACIAMCALALPCAAQTPASFQQSGMLTGGGRYVVRHDPASLVAAIDLWFRAPGAGYDLQYPGISRLAVTAIAASSVEHGTPVSELVRRYGGTLTIEAYPDIVMIGASVPANRAASVLRALTTAFFSPQITTSGFKAAQRDAAVAAAESAFEPARVMQDALFAEVFTAGPAHYPATPSTVADLTKIPQDAVSAFATRAFSRANAVLTLAGAVDASMLPRAGVGASGTASPPIDSTVATAPSQTTKNGSEPGLGYAWIGPPILDAKAATAMDFIADYLFDPDHGTVAAAVAHDTPDAYVEGQFITLHDPGVLLASVSGGSSQVLERQVLGAVAAMQQPMNAQRFEAARAAFEYHILRQTQRPSERADVFGWYTVEGNPAYAPGDASGTYLQAAESLDPQYVASIARKYLSGPFTVKLFAAPSKGRAA